MCKILSFILLIDFFFILWYFFSIFINKEIFIMKNFNLKRSNEYTKYTELNKLEKSKKVKVNILLYLLITLFLILLFITIYFFKFNSNEKFNLANNISNSSEQPETSDVATNESPISFSLSAIGDIMCHNSQYMDAYDASSDTYDFSYVFKDIEEYIKSADISIGNLETSFAGKSVRI